MVVSTHGTIIKLVQLFLKSWIELNKGMRRYVSFDKSYEEIFDHNTIIDTGIVPLCRVCDEWLLDMIKALVEFRE
jgi:hypothetical protein